jgi:hypothetical protein
MMSWNNRWVLGVKLMGVWCLFIALGELFYLVPEYLRYYERLGQRSGLFTLPALSWLAIPAGMAALGLYLIRDGKFVHNLGEAHFGTITGGAREWFVLGILLYGLYFIVLSIPVALRLPFHLLVMALAPVYESTADSTKWIAVQIPPAFGSALIGYLFIVRANVICDLAFRWR